MAIVVQRSFILVPGGLAEFERLSREKIWPYFEARGCKIVGLYTNVHGGPSNEVVLNTAYASLAHWESTRDDAPLPDDAGDDARRLYPAYLEGLKERRKLVTVTSSRVFRAVASQLDYGVEAK